MHRRDGARFLLCDWTAAGEPRERRQYHGSVARGNVVLLLERVLLHIEHNDAVDGLSRRSLQSGLV
jgi:hypothetical protein